MGRSSVVKATRELARELSESLRHEDAVMLTEAYGVTPLRGILRSIQDSSEAHVLTIDGKAAAAFGLSDFTQTMLSTRRALVWVVTGERAFRNPKEFVKASRVVVRAWADKYDELFNHVDARYEGARKWLRSLGFRETGEFHLNGFKFLNVVRATPCA